MIINIWRTRLIDAMQDISLNFNSDSLFTLTDKIKASVEGRISWGDTFGVGLGNNNNKHLIIWTPKVTSESQILPAFDSQDGKLTLKIKHRPGAWISWIDEAKIQASAHDDYDRVHKSVQELERNTRQITDFADGVITNITVQHLGKSLTLSELTEEVLESRLIVPNSIKTGGFVFTRTDTDDTSVKVVIPEQTHIHRLHLNEDVMYTEIENGGYDTVLVVVRTLIKTYPDLTDLGDCLTIHNKFIDEKGSEKPPSVKVLPTAAVYNPIEPTFVKLVPITFTAQSDVIEEAIADSSSKIENYIVKANEHVFQLMAQFHQGVESRLRALMLNRGQRIHNKVWDDLVIRELRNTLSSFCGFYESYLGEHFEQEATRSTTDALKDNIDPIIEQWQLQENQELTINYMIQSSYTLTNQLVDKATALFHDLVFETDLIDKGYVKPVNLKISENDIPMEEIYLPEWTSGTVREKLNRIGIRSTLHPEQLDRLHNIWSTLLHIANFTSMHQQDFERLVQPLENILLAKKPANTNKNNLSNRNSTARFTGFEIDDSELENIFKQIDDSLHIIKLWVEQTPSETEKLQSYYTTLWSLVLNGKTREKLLTDFQPVCDINISVPDQTKRLMNLTLESQLVVENEKDRKTLERNLNKALVAKTGHSIRDITTAKKLEIHSDVTLSLLRQELEKYDDTLTKRASRFSNPQRKGKKRNAANPNNNGNLTYDTIQAEQTKVSEMITFLKPYGETQSLYTLAHAGVNKRGTDIEELRKNQVLSFDLNELPEIDKTWLTDVKTLDDYQNLRVFLLQNQLPISTTGRILMELRNILSDDLFNQVLGLIQEVKELQNSSYEGEVLDRFVSYISEKVWRWELTQITNDELPVIVKEKVLSTAVCYEKEVETLMEYVERYDELLDTKLNADAEMIKQRENLESRFQEIVETLI